MRKMNTLFTMLLIVTLSNFAFGQQNRSVYTIGSTFTTGSGSNPQNTCYPATPLSIRPDASNNNTSADTNTNFSNSHLYTTSPIADLDVVIANAYTRGYRHFYFQEGTYIISTPINLNNLNGITIEGAGAGTVFKPSSTALTTIFDVKNCYNGKIKNLGIDLKTTIICGTGGQDTNDINTGIKIGNQVGRCLFEGIYS
jgi:hypothetical protein